MIKYISASQLQEALKEQPLNIIDVRERVEFAMGHIPTAVNLYLATKHLIKIKHIISFAKVVPVQNKPAFF